ncbi:hypothetical protein ALNOE001_08170 [Candidatus Methanobinarius endosymbioticus]|uniref:Bacterial Ig-like domain-containing protein n=1 Tax=Candidatus Methanobinarius endosymbioticus TaxID=2006182 RepID=A0A366MCN2_9EURY|nr:hypothetical protein ALNOE001_08170 [Candidatus Methanobinarius endosymbioticus]
MTTHSDGEWDLTYTPTRAGNLQIQVTYDGNALFNGFTSITQFVAREPKIIPPTPNETKQKSVLKVKVKGNNVITTLTDKDGNHISVQKLVLKDKKGNVLG